MGRGSMTRAWGDGMLLILNVNLRTNKLLIIIATILQLMPSIQMEKLFISYQIKVPK